MGTPAKLREVLALLRLKIHQTSPGMIEDSGWPYWYLVSGTCFVATAACLLFIYVSKTAWPELKDTAWLVDVFFFPLRWGGEWNCLLPFLTSSDHFEDRFLLDHLVFFSNLTPMDNAWTPIWRMICSNICRSASIRIPNSKKVSISVILRSFCPVLLVHYMTSIYVIWI